MRKDWPQLQISDVQVANKDRQSIFVGESLQLSARVHLGGVDPQHVRVEEYHITANLPSRANRQTSLINAFAPSVCG